MCSNLLFLVLRVVFPRAASFRFSASPISPDPSSFDVDIPDARSSNVLECSCSCSFLQDAFLDLVERKEEIEVQGQEDNRRNRTGITPLPAITGTTHRSDFFRFTSFSYRPRFSPSPPHAPYLPHTSSQRTRDSDVASDVVLRPPFSYPSFLDFLPIKK
ncbi:hypothetical protein C8R47DRAFT_1129659 [Mycena vitilis]|nr:hypothetical protein C8R47DRAFT_1129659 [Mycena vitilis]